MLIKISRDSRQAERQFKAYSKASDEELFEIEPVAVELKDIGPTGSPRSRVICASCGEGINDGREVSNCTARRDCMSTMPRKVGYLLTKKDKPREMTASKALPSKIEFSRNERNLSLRV